MNRFWDRCILDQRSQNLVVLAQRGKKRPELRISNDVCCLGRSGMFYFPTCFLLRFVSSSGLFTHVLFRHVLWSLRHVLFSDMFSARTSFLPRPLPSFPDMVAPSFPVPARTFEAQYWKKLTCGVIRSFN